MGAIFNTPGTIAILNFLNSHYDPKAATGFAHARGNAEHQILRNKANWPTSYRCALQLGLDNAAYTGRWKKWLDKLDAYYQTKDADYGGNLVRKMMADALDPADANCIGIEFFAVPAAKFYVHYPAPKVQDVQNPAQYTRVIVVETNTVDNTLSSVRRRRSFWKRIFSSDD